MMISVILCAHNPTESLLKQTLKGLQEQILPHDHWELILVDNACREPLESRFPLPWHQNGRCLHVAELGLTSARLAGMRAAAGEVVVLVDDDNVLTPGYLTEVVAISERYPFLGAWSGSVVGEYEDKRSSKMETWEHLLAVRTCEEDQWGYAYGLSAILPFGAGMCVRRAVCERYIADCAEDTSRARLDRRGVELASGGDLDIAYTALDLEYGIGRFRNLQLTHLVPAERMTTPYLSRLAYGSSMTAVLLAVKRPQTRNLIPRPGLMHLLIYLLFSVKGGISSLRIVFSSWRGIRAGWKLADAGPHGRAGEKSDAP